MAAPRQFRHLIVTGGAGFIGSHFVRLMLERHPETRITVLDKLTYAGNLENLADLGGNPRYAFERGDIADADVVERLARDADGIVNFAAESHVDRSIHDPTAFAMTGVVGTTVLLEAARRHGHTFFLQVGTDEVYGNVPEGSSDEGSLLRPRSPYAAAKAGSDLMALAYGTTYELPVAVTRSSNNFGPNQYPEKVIPLFITNALDGLELPIYGDGGQVRDWIYVGDNCAAIETVLLHGEPGGIYNVGGSVEIANIELARAILRETGKGQDLMRLVEDRPGHDRRYSVDDARVRALGWQPETEFTTALGRTVAWYRDHRSWWEPLKAGDYAEFYRHHYGRRLAESRPAS